MCQRAEAFGNVGVRPCDPPTTVLPQCLRDAPPCVARPARGPRSYTFSRPDGALIGPRDALVMAQAERVADRVGVGPPAIAVGADGVLLQFRAEGYDAALFRLDVVHFEVEVELLGVLVVGPLRGAVVLHPGEGQLHLAEGDAGPVAVAALLDRAACHLGVEGCQLHRVRAVDDDIRESQHPAILPQEQRRRADENAESPPRNRAGGGACRAISSGASVQHRGTGPRPPAAEAHGRRRDRPSARRGAVPPLVAAARHAGP